MKGKMSSILLSAFLFHSVLFSQSGWVQQLSGTTHGLKAIFCLNENTAWVCGSAGVILKTSNGGANWVNLNLLYTNNLSDIFFIDAQTGWTCGGFLNFPQIALFHILKTTNGGANWAVTSTFGSVSSPYISSFNSVSFINALTGFVTVSTTDGFTGSGYVLKSTNGGLNWSMSGPQKSNIEITFLSSSLGFLISRYWDDMSRDTAYFYKTTDLGESWIMMSKYSGYSFSRMSFINNTTGWIAGLRRTSPASFNGVVFNTVNGGVNWSYTDIVGNSMLTSVTFPSIGTGYVCGSEIYKSINGGINWIRLNIPVFMWYNDIQMINNTTGWCVGNAGVILRTTNGGIAVKKISEEIPVKCYLHQNYPNPFNPITRIQFDIPASRAGGNVNTKLIIYDILGRKVSELVNEEMPPGVYEVDWNGSNYPSGVYYYSLQTKEFSQTKKMILIK